MWAQHARQIGLSFVAVALALNTVWAAEVEPLFAKFLPQANATGIAETAVGKILLSGVASGLHAMADPACLRARNLGEAQFTLLARQVVVSVSEAREKANATGLDPRAADAAYEAQLGPDRFRRVAEFKMRLSDPVLKTYWDAAVVRVSVSAILSRHIQLAVRFNSPAIRMLAVFSTMPSMRRALGQSRSQVRMNTTLR